MTERDDNDERKDPRDRPADPAGTRPKVDPDSLVPAQREPLVSPAIESTAVDEDAPPQLLPERVAAAGAPEPAARSDDEAPHAPRFQFLLGALVMLGVAALAIVVVIAASGPPERAPTGPSWSSWRPADNGTSAPEQIAQHIGKQYRLADGDQLALATGGSLEFGGVQLAIAVREPADQGGNISLINGKGVLYHLCGLGPKCSLPGKPSDERGLLLRREALELALYTFRYTDADHVVAVLPPGRTKKTKTKPSKIKDPDAALFFQRPDVAHELEQPVTATLTPRTPRPATFMRSPDTGVVQALTGPRVWQFSVTPGNLENRGYLVLQRFKAPK